MNKYIIVSLVWAASIGVAFFYGQKSIKSNPPAQSERTKENTERQVETITEIIQRPGETHTIIKEVEKVKTQIKTDTKLQKLDWNLSISKSLKDNEYSLGVTRRIIGDIYLGAYGTTNKEYGITVGVSF